MPYRCSCGYENTNGKKFAGHLGRYSKFGHRKVGWVDETGEVLDSRPRGGSKPQGKQAAPEVLVVSQGQAPPEKEFPGEKTGLRVAIDPQTATIIRAIPVRVEFAYTPQMWTGFQCAKLHGFSGELCDWLSLISLEFWWARGINPFEEMGVVFETVPSLANSSR